MSIVGRGAEQFTVRFPDGLRDRIKAAADANNRSMNAEIIATLGDKYPEDVDPVVEEIVEAAMRLPRHEMDRFLDAFVQKLLDSGEFAEKDIEDGLLPGVTLRRVSVTD